jgi:hypothetical protein
MMVKDYEHRLSKVSNTKKIKPALNQGRPINNIIIAAKLL